MASFFMVKIVLIDKKLDSSVASQDDFNEPSFSAPSYVGYLSAHPCLRIMRIFPLLGYLYVERKVRKKNWSSRFKGVGKLAPLYS